MFPLVDRDGLTKPTIQIIAEEAIQAGIEQICIVTSPGDEDQYRRHFRGISEDLLPSFKGKEWALRESEKLQELQDKIEFVAQEKPEGYGHAVYCARDFVGDEPFLLLLGDHVYVSGDDAGCARQVIDVYERHGCTVSAVKQTSEDLIHLYGTILGNPVESDGHKTYEVVEMKEKPTIDYADSRLRTEGLRRGFYLCFFGMHVFTPTLFECIEYHIKHDIRERGEIQLTNAQDMLRRTERYVAFEAKGERYDMGVPFGLVETQIALALHSPARDEMLASLVGIIAKSGMSKMDSNIWR